MANIDVTELLTDPDFSDAIDVTRRVQTVGVDGVAVIAPTPVLGVVAVVQPGGKDALVRVPDAGNPDDWIVAYTTQQLVAHDLAAGRYGDLLTWRGREYQVALVDDWSNYGANYVKALARLVLP